MKIFVTGSSGFIGKNVVKSFKENHQTWGISRTASDSTDFTKNLLDADIGDVLDNVNPEVIIHCAALPNVDYCEEHPDDAFKQNVESTKNIVNWAKENDATVVFISTDYVYPGGPEANNESSRVEPLNVYGQAKLEAEKLVMNLSKYVILRTTGVFGYDVGGKNFLMQILTNNTIRNVPSDQISNPTDVSLLVHFIRRLVEKKIYGLFIAAGPEPLSRADFAFMISDVFGKDKTLLKKVKTSELNQKARRPLNNVLDSSKLYSILGEKIPTVRTSLEKIRDSELV